MTRDSDTKQDTEKRRPILHCTFCGKSQREVRKLIAGPTVYICDECISLCNDIIAEELNLDAAPKEPKAPKAPVTYDTDAICMFCLADKRDVKLLIGGGIGYICDACAASCHEFAQKNVRQ